MKVAFFKMPGEVELRQLERPRPERPGEVLVRVLACGICGSDAYAYRQGSSDWRRAGHEYAGVVEEVGEGVGTLAPGAIVAAIGSLPCGKCGNCQRGLPQYCVQPRWCGGDAFVEYVCKEVAFFFPIPGLTAEEGALIEPLTVAIDLVRDGQVSFGSKVLLIGAGPIGLMALRLCKLAGASKVYVSHPSTSAARKKLAEQWGADAFVFPDQGDWVKRMVELEPKGVDSVLITVRPSAVIAEAVQVAAKGGTLAFVGMEWRPSVTLSFNLDHFHSHKLRLVGSSHNPSSRLYPQAAELLQNKHIAAEQLISQRFPLDDIKEAFEYVVNRRSEVIKVMITAAHA